jgi:hypothetical protein
MPTISQQAEFAQDPRIIGPLRAALATAAIAISNEDPAAPNHAQRAMLAGMVLRSPMSQVEAFAWALSTNAVVVQQWADDDVEGAFGNFAYVISTVWDALARA